MADHLLFKDPRTRDNIGGDERTFAMLSHDKRRVLQLKVGTFDGDNADAEVGGELADGRDFIAGFPLPDSDPLFDLVHNLLVERSAGLRENDAGETSAHAVYTEYAQCQ